MTYQFALAQLRHAYSQLHAGTVKDQRQFAEGLLGPAIEALERGIEQSAFCKDCGATDPSHRPDCPRLP